MTLLEEGSGAQAAQRGGILWLTGLPGAGKSTIARALAVQVKNQGGLVYVLDGDELRERLNRDLGYGVADRRENIRRVAEVARLFADAGALAIVALISPAAVDRAAARAIAGVIPFIEVHVHADADLCETRDPKGFYRQARTGQLRGFTGVDAPYEPPDRPDARVDTGSVTVAAAVAQLTAALAARGMSGCSPR